MFKILSTISVDDLNRIVAPIVEICGVLIPVMLSVVGAVGGLYCILLYLRTLQNRHQKYLQKACVLQHQLHQTYEQLQELQVLLHQHSLKKKL